MPAVPAGLVLLAGVTAVVVVAQHLVEDAKAPQYEERPRKHDGDHEPYSDAVGAAHDPGAHAQERRPGVHDDHALAHAIALAQKHVVQVLAVGLLDRLMVVHAADNGRRRVGDGDSRYHERHRQHDDRR